MNINLQNASLSELRSVFYHILLLFLTFEILNIIPNISSITSKRKIGFLNIYYKIFYFEPIYKYDHTKLYTFN